MWFQKKKIEEVTNPGKKKSGFEKLVMGAIIGVAVGSVVGMAVAPQKGSDTRKMIADKSREAVEKGKEFGQKMVDESREKKVKKGFLRWLLRLVLGGAKRKTAPLKKIPSEQPAQKGGGNG